MSPTTILPSTSGRDEIARPARSADMPPPTGVRGWLLLLCVMLTVVGPLISVWIVAREFDALAPRFVTSHGAQWATILVIASTTCSVLFGIHAGLRLWAVKPRAVAVARAALLFGLAVDVCTTTISTILGTALPAGDRLFYAVLLNLAPSLVFFTACLAYLNRSRRVEATYRSPR
jgi:hypothetical protein